jgi:hypothetical protein
MLPYSLSQLNTVLVTCGSRIQVVAPQGAFLITPMATNLRLGQGHDEDRIKVMYLQWVNNLLLGTPWTRRYLILEL